MSNLSFAGQYILDALDWIQPGGLALDVREHFQQIIIYEDMFAPFTSANIIMRDTIDIPNLYLNAGTDLIRIRVRTPSMPEVGVIDKYFHVYKLDERTQVSDRSQTYLVHLISKENIFDQSTKISTTFRGSPEDISSIICDKYLQTDKTLLIDPTKNSINYTSNYWCPSRNLNYVAERAVGDGNLPSYLFFENRDGFNLKELTSFAKSKLPFMQSWHSNNYIADISSDGQVIRDISKDYQTVLDVNVDVNFDHMKDSMTGLLKTRSFTYDFITREFGDRTATILDSDLPILNQQRFYQVPVVQNSGAAHMTGFSHFDSYNGAGYNSNAVNTIHKRNVIMRAFQQHKIEITVFGRTDYTVGKRASFDANKLREFNKGSNQLEIPDNMLSGTYIVSAVRHLFTRDNKHNCKIELMTDSIQTQT